MKEKDIAIVSLGPWKREVGVVRDTAKAMKKEAVSVRAAV